MKKNIILAMALAVLACGEAAAQPFLVLAAGGGAGAGRLAPAPHGWYTRRVPGGCATLELRGTLPLRGCGLLEGGLGLSRLSGGEVRAFPSLPMYPGYPVDFASMTFAEWRLTLVSAWVGAGAGHGRLRASAGLLAGLWLGWRESSLVAPTPPPPMGFVDDFHGGFGRFELGLLATATYKATGRIEAWMRAYRGLRDVATNAGGRAFVNAHLMAGLGFRLAGGLQGE